jgi:DNA (cytosine-5)-methyltransferase 1
MADSMEGRLNCVDLFAGAGGFSLGFQEAGFDIVAAVDRSESALATYNHNLEGVQTIEADLQQVSPEEVVDKIGIAPDKVDVIIGGPPCKGFSTAGKMDSGNSKNSLVANYIGIVSGIQPQLVVMENVTGILSMEGGAYKERIIGGFRQEGFQISDNPIVLNAADFGVPQRRNRVFFLATRHDEIEPPKPTHYDPSLDPIARPETAEKPWVALEDAIGDLSFLQYGEEAEEYKLRPLSEYQKAIRCVNSSQLTNHKATNHSERVRERFKQLGYGESGEDLPEEYQTKKHSLQRWDPDEPAPTVTTLPDDFIHYEHPRTPTVRELARIQSFPDWFEFKGPRTTGGKRRQDTVPQYSQVGNAVPPRLAKNVAEAVKKNLQVFNTV